jgi:dihydroorotase
MTPLESVETHDLLLSGGSVLTPGGVEEVDVAIAGGRIAAVGRDLGAARRVIVCSGAWVGPGFVDIHAHLREPGEGWNEDIASGSAAGAAGGYTAVIAMPNTDPPVDTGALALHVVEQGRRAGLVEVASAGCLTMGRKGDEAADLDALWDAGVRMFTDDGDVVANARVLRSAMEFVANLGGIVSQHAVDSDLSISGHMHEGSVSLQLEMDGIPREADEIIIARDIALVRLTGVRYHVQHLSTARSVELVAAAKAEGLAVTAEVSPHHLMFDHNDVLRKDTRFKMMPPLREPQDREALVAGLREGVIDAVATDHAPHGAQQKAGSFQGAANGVTGLEWAAAAANEVAQLDQATFFNRMSVRPALIGAFREQGRALKKGNRAHIVVFDPTAVWTPDSSLSKSANSPYLGRDLVGRVNVTLLDGMVTYEA